MTDRPIIFSAPMVRALLDGRKTMTRRVLKPQPECCVVDGVALPIGLEHVEGRPFPQITVGRVITRQNVRFVPGDRLWVRENWSHSGVGVWSIFDARLSGRSGVIYAADWKEAFKPKWFPSIHMPREFSRLTLIVEGVKVERLQDISEADAIAEGVVAGKTTFDYDIGEVEKDWFTVPGFEDPGTGVSAVDMYAQLWNGINGPDAWALNPYVATISFRVAKANIDAMESANV